VNVPPEINALLQQERVARLAMVDEAGRPHVVPIVFALAGDSVYTPIDSKPKSVDTARLRRVRNIATNAGVTVLVDRYQEDWSRLWYVQLRGQAHLLERGNRYQEGIELLEEKYAQYGAMPLTGRPVIWIEVERVVSWGLD
jgi:PPOX class probable F420-dependent enzyme